jgi:hypothetical protein
MGGDLSAGFHVVVHWTHADNPKGLESRAHWHYAKLLDGYVLERSMGDSDYLWLQANIICLLLFILGTTMIIGRPEWFH